MILFFVPFHSLNVRSSIVQRQLPRETSGFSKRSISNSKSELAEGVGFEPTADAEQDGGLRLLGIGGIPDNKKACRCSYFGSYSSLWRACGSIRNLRFGPRVSPCVRRICRQNVGNGA